MLLSLAALRDLGVGLALDHFGTLDASPRVLQRLPLTAVKLDPCLTRELINDRAVRATVKAAIALAHALGASVLATEVANPTQRDILADLGCDDAQGPIVGGAQQPEVFHASLLVPGRQ
jgi:EAL domain-containing protein (putative c-di-GMP-specific phosphodiesterase class I)